MNKWKLAAIVLSAATTGTQAESPEIQKNNMVQIDQQQEETTANSPIEKESTASIDEPIPTPPLHIEQEAEGSKDTIAAVQNEEKPAQRLDAAAILSAIPLDENPPEKPFIPQENYTGVGYNDRKSWWFKRNSVHTPPSAQGDIAIGNYDAYYLGDISRKAIYLTFDEGYENGYTAQILDVLKEKDVQAAFFVTKSYIESEPELVKRMVAEGHIVGNHSVTHPDLTKKSNEEILWELEECASYFEEVTGTKMPPYFRPPEGVYSIRTLEKTKEAGYKTIFWSFAYQDWDRNNQPGKQAAYNMVMNNYHNGSIMLLHAVSQSNTEALSDIIDSLRAEGYTFVSLDALPDAQTLAPPQPAAKTDTANGQETE